MTAIRFPFRVLLFSWGIAIDITGELRHVGVPRSGSAEVCPGVALWLHPSVTLTASELELVKSGLRRVGSELARGANGQVAVIELSEVWSAPADYQPEGLEAAIIGWAAEIAGFDPPVIEMTFDRASNRYVFAYM